MGGVQRLRDAPTASVPAKVLSMVDADRIHSVDDARLWAVEHDAKVAAWWHEQWRANAKCELRITDHGQRLRQIERRMAGMAAVGGLVGAVVGQVLFAWLAS